MICPICRKRETQPNYKLCYECEQRFVAREQAKGGFTLSKEECYSIALKMIRAMYKVGVLEL